MFCVSGECTINPAARKLFSPERESSSSKAPSIEAVMKSLFLSCKDASVFQYVNIDSVPKYNPEDDINVDSDVFVETSACLPLPLTEIAKREQNVSDFLSNLPILSEAEISILEEQTVGQSDSDLWRSQRQGRITASIAHNVMTKMNTLSTESKRSKNTDSLVSSIMGYKMVNSNIPALKYGRVMEDEARESYTKTLVSLGHKHIKVRKSGLWLMSNHQYLGASPDALVSCSCCGSGIVEIKCPLSIAHQNPEEANLAFLDRSTNVIKLKKTHQYYSQIQTQLGVTNKQWGDFFVYTRHGHYLQRIQFDQLKFNSILSASHSFFHQYVANELVFQTIKNQLTAQMSTSSDPAEIQQLDHHFDPAKNIAEIYKTVKEVYLCGTCNSVCKDKPEEDHDNSVACDFCDIWYHWGCIGLNIDNINEEFVCPKCEAQSS